MGHSKSPPNWTSYMSLCNQLFIIFKIEFSMGHVLQKSVTPIKFPSNWFIFLPISLLTDNIFPKLVFFFYFHMLPKNRKIKSKSNPLWSQCFYIIYISMNSIQSCIEASRIPNFLFIHEMLLSSLHAINYFKPIQRNLVLT